MEVFARPVLGSIEWSPIAAGSGPYLQLAVVLATLAPLALLVWLYRTELRLVSPFVARGLVALRLAAVAVILVVVCFRPAWRWHGAEEVRGRVIVAVDRSDSMSVTDPQRPLLEKLTIARALHLNGDLCSDREIDNWIADLAGVGSDVAAPGSITDGESRRKLDRVCQRVESLNRGSLAAAVLNDGRFLADLEAQHDVSLLGFAGSAAPLTRDALAQPGTNGNLTDLGAPLEAAASDPRPIAVVLLTDGRQTADHSPSAKALALGRLGVPVHAISLAPRQAPPDIAVANVRAPDAVFKGAEIAIEAAVQVNALPARDLKVILSAPGRPDVVQSIAHPGGTRRHLLRLPVRIDEAGTHGFTVRVAAEPEDTHPENDARSVAIQASDDRARVLLIDGEARWEFHYLASALERDRSMDPGSVVFAQPRIERLTGDGGLPARQLPADADALDRYDAIVLGDVAPNQLPLADRERLDRYVSERGGTLIVIAGKKAMPFAYLRPSLEQDPIRKLLPIESGRAVAPVSGFAVNLTPEGRLASFLQLAATPEANDEQWSDLPRHFWGFVGRVKPGASVLACDRDPVNENAADPDGWAKDHALISRHNVGFGRVLLIGLESTWRFRMRTGDALHHRFWGQVIRWAAADQPLIVGNSTVRFGPRRAVVPQGDEAEIGVRWLDASRPLREPAAVRVWRRNVGAAEELVATAPVQPLEARPRELEARIGNLQPGEYAAELIVPDRTAELPMSGGAPIRAAFRIKPRESPERDDLSGNQDLLEQLAAQTGGRVVAPDQAADLVANLARQTVTRDTVHEWNAGRSWLLLALVLTLLGTEWTVRKLAGLP